jgi:hypothetical protein
MISLRLRLIARLEKRRKYRFLRPTTRKVSYPRKARLLIFLQIWPSGARWVVTRS